MGRRSVLAGGAAAALAAGAPAPAKRHTGNWFDRAIVIDALSGSGDPEAPQGVTRLSDESWSRLVATGLTAVRTTLLPVGNVPDPWAVFQQSIADERALLAANPERLLLVRSAADILKAKREGRHGLILGTQDTVMVGPALDRLAEMKTLGVTTVQLTYNNANLAGDGALETRNAGLTKLGRATIERVEAEKLLLDLSHGGARTMAEGAAQARRPLVISHTGARALHDHPRNTDDATIRAVAEKGGVVGVYFMPFLVPDSRPRGEDLLRHVEHVANVAGEDHVAIGTDNGPLPVVLTPEAREFHRKWVLERIKAGIASPGEAPDVFNIVADYHSVDRYRRLSRDLERRGWPVRRIEKLMGANLLRVYRDAWS
ncbi:dipeptidase [Sphingomonas mesophila]|uniref:dipeptidase n=1 Tax=Sphingomonas mesophila TaxID=2303576 RepID=UPI0013C2B316|nr:membrane dipeptidase [Sphingomonas mesophila]